MLAHPPNTFWQDAACSLAEPSPGFTAKIVLPIPIFSLVISVYFVWIASITGANSVSASTGFLSASTASCAALTSFALGQLLSDILRPRRIGTELSHDVLNPARVPL